ncbi:putative hydrolase of the HAD superfamily [Spinactinospora alkalitolerans]|uniref:Putative hydrolase of the HAD superfamily n=1 Tax=Spinactinospora alkalitolerans TaxID=687207 RepID=A0A852TSH4_9ACTN|nr:HAD family hydrolase [Spinactinospora alkalitolerans]NYE47356.1 putative hydrolase of the HAD superfamily [Spinactinospora alkalitolerans]
MPEHHQAPAAIFFDLDDTLLDDHAASSNGLRALMERLGHPDFQAARRLWDVQIDISFNAYIAGRLTLTEQRRERVRALATQAGHSWISDDHCDDLYRRYLDAHRAAWHSFHDAAPALTRLASHRIPLGVITNGIETLQRDKLAAMDITHHFTTIICADTAGAGKPDPRIFHTACRQLGADPRRCWHIGDQLRADALGAISAGLRPILLDRHGNHRGQTDITTITGLDELPGLAAPTAAGLL